MERLSSIKKVAEGHFEPEGYISDGSEEYLKQLLAVVKQMGFEPAELIFSGFDGTPLKHEWPPSKHLTVFGMNQAGWLRATQNLETNPAEYAAGWPTPCIALYDRNLLAEAYTYDFPDVSHEDASSRLDLNNVQKGRNLVDVDTDEALEEAFIHKDYPQHTPDEALLGVVYLHD